MPMFAAKGNCRECFVKENGPHFEMQFFELFNKHVESESLDLWLYHMHKISEISPFHYCNSLISVILPIFRREKEEYLKNVETNLKAKNLLISCLNIILISCMKDTKTVKLFFNGQNIKHIRDLSMIADFAKVVCSLLKVAAENLSCLGKNERQSKEWAQLIINILNKNTLYLIEELEKYFKDLTMKKNLNKLPVDSPKDSLQEINQKVVFNVRKVDSEKCAQHEEEVRVEIEPMPGPSQLQQSSTSSDYQESNSSNRRNSTELEDYEVLGETSIIIEENLTFAKILHLASLYLSTIAKLLNSSAQFQSEFAEKVVKKYESNLFFHLLYNTLETILLTNELAEYQIKLDFGNYCAGNFKRNLEMPVEISTPNSYRKVMMVEGNCDYETVMKIYQYELNEKRLGFNELLSMEVEDDLLKLFSVKRGQKMHIEQKSTSHYSENEFFSLFHIDQSEIQSFSAKQHSSNEHINRQPLYQRIYNNLMLEKQIISDKLAELFMRFMNFKSDAGKEKRLEFIRRFKNDECLDSLNGIWIAALEILFHLSTLSGFGEFL